MKITIFYIVFVYSYDVVVADLLIFNVWRFEEPTLSSSEYYAIKK